MEITLFMYKFRFMSNILTPNFLEQDQTNHILDTLIFTLYNIVRYDS